MSQVKSQIFNFQIQIEAQVIHFLSSQLAYIKTANQVQVLMTPFSPHLAKTEHIRQRSKTALQHRPCEETDVFLSTKAYKPILVVTPK